MKLKEQVVEVLDKKIKNYALQGLTLIFSTSSGFKNKYIRPGEIISIPESYITKQVKELHRRRLIKIF